MARERPACNILDARSSGTYYPAGLYYRICAGVWAMGDLQKVLGTAEEPEVDGTAERAAEITPKRTPESFEEAGAMGVKQSGIWRFKLCFRDGNFLAV